ncbi:hypothetical protein Trydic_g2066 [Trypoxylus dichotomus]
MRNAMWVGAVVTHVALVQMLGESEPIIKCVFLGIILRPQVRKNSSVHNSEEPLSRQGVRTIHDSLESPVLIFRWWCLCLSKSAKGITDTKGKRRRSEVHSFPLQIVFIPSVLY